MKEVIYRIEICGPGRVYHTKNQEFAMYWKNSRPFDIVTPLAFDFVNSADELEAKETERRREDALDKLTEGDKILLGLK